VVGVGDGGGAVNFPRRILLATDGSRAADLAASVAAELAAATDSALHVVHVGRGHPLWFERHEALVEWLRREAQEFLDRQVGKIEDSGGLVARTHLRMNNRPDEAIVNLSEDMGAGLIVVGSRGRGRLRRALVGSVGDRIVRRARCPVLVVKQEQSR
jgi:nucleotide-binding universal stress UspA family protein